MLNNNSQIEEAVNSRYGPRASRKREDGFCRFYTYYHPHYYYWCL